MTAVLEMNNPPTIWASSSIMCSCWLKKKKKKKSFPAKNYISQASTPSVTAKRLGSANQLWIEVIYHVQTRIFKKSVFFIIFLPIQHLSTLRPPWMQGLQEGRNLDPCIPAERKPTHQAGLSTLNWPWNSCVLPLGKSAVVLQCHCVYKHQWRMLQMQGLTLTQRVHFHRSVWICALGTSVMSPCWRNTAKVDTAPLIICPTPPPLD